MEPLIAWHNLLLAHSKAVKLYREQFQASEVILCTAVLYFFFFFFDYKDQLMLMQHKQGGMMGVAVSAMMYEPLSDDELDKEAANRALAFSLAW